VPAALNNRVDTLFYKELMNIKMFIAELTQHNEATNQQYDITDYRINKTEIP
jgi:hypothetical protein